jgi:HEAT repeat protein
MSKHVVSVLFGFAAGVLGNLVAAYIQQDIWSNIFTTPRLIVTTLAALFMLGIVAFLESEKGLALNWLWHRYWYLQEVLRNPGLQPWKADFAQLELTERQLNVSGPEVIADGKRRDLVETLRHLIAGPPGQLGRALILGEPGSGKTTALKRLTFELAEEGIRRWAFGPPIPILVRLSEFTGGRLLDHVSSVVRHSTTGPSGKVLSKAIEELAERRRMVLLFDAVDEALGDRREIVLTELASLLQSQSYRHLPVVITSRTREDPGGRLQRNDEPLKVFEIQDLSDEAIRVFLRIYKDNEHSETEIWEGLNTHRLLEPGGLGRNPFWLRLIIEGGAFDGNKQQILNKAVDTLLSREWDDKPEVKRSWLRVLPRDDQLRETKRGLAWLGYQMSILQKGALPGDQAEDTLKQWLDKRGRVAGELRPQDVIGLSQDGQILKYDAQVKRDRSQALEFRHRLLQEFMTASALNYEKSLLTLELVEECGRDTRWWETILMLGSMTSDHPALVRCFLGNGQDSQRLMLAVGLLASVPNPKEELKHQVAVALTESLRQGFTPEHKQAAVALAGIAGDEVMDGLNTLLGTEFHALRKGVIDILEAIGPPRAMDILVSHLGDEIIMGRVAEVLGAIGEPAIPLLILALRDEAPLKSAGAVQAFVRMGPLAVAPLIKLFWSDRSDQPEEKLRPMPSSPPSWEPGDEQKNRHMRAGALQALVQIGKPAIKPLIDLLREEINRVSGLAARSMWKGGRNSPVSEEATQMLVQIGQAAVEPLIGLLGDERKSVLSSRPERDSLFDVFFYGLHREILTRPEPVGGFYDSCVVQALLQVGQAAIEPLIDALQHNDEYVRAGTAAVLGKIGDTRAIDPLMALLSDEHSLVWQEAAQAVRQISHDERSPESLIASLCDENTHVRREAAKALRQISPDARAIAPLVRVLRHVQIYTGHVGYYGPPVYVSSKHLEERETLDSAALALGKIGQPAVVPLIKAFQEGNWSVYPEVARALEKIGTVAVEPLIEAFQDDDAHVRIGSAMALGQIRDARAIAPLINLLQDHNAQLRLAAIEALRQVKDRRAIAPLIKILQSEDYHEREAAVRALGEIGDERMLPDLKQLVEAAELMEPWGKEAKAADAAKKVIVRILATQGDGAKSGSDSHESTGDGSLHTGTV